MNYKNEAREAIRRVDRIIQEWEENRVGDHETVELLIPDLKTITCYLETIQNKVNEDCYKKRKGPDKKGGI